VIGPLASQHIVLQRFPVVTTTGGEWRSRHPGSQALALTTGHKRDYSEGAASRNYFENDALMFPVPQPEDRLNNKAEVLGLLLDEAQPLAIAAAFLAKNPIHHDVSGDTKIVVLTDVSGANRVYKAGDMEFVQVAQDGVVIAKDGSEWQQNEQTLMRDDGAKLPRLPAHRAFWFGWHAAFPETRWVF